MPKKKPNKDEKLPSPELQDEELKSVSGGVMRFEGGAIFMSQADYNEQSKIWAEQGHPGQDLSGATIIIDADQK